MGEEYFIGITVPSPYKEQIMELRKPLVEKEVIKNKKSYFPHITVYAQGFDDEERIKKLFRFGFRSFILNLKELEVFRRNGMKEILHINVSLESELIKVQNLTLDILGPIRNNELQNKILEYKERFSKRELELTKKYGFPHLEEQYIPHITLGSFDQKEKLEKAMKAFKQLKLPGEIAISKISLFKKIDKLWKEIGYINSEK